MSLWDDFIGGTKQVLGQVGESASDVWTGTTSAVESGIEAATQRWIRQETTDAPEQPAGVTGWEGIAPGAPGLLGQAGTGQAPTWGQPDPAAATERDATPTPPAPAIPWGVIAGGGLALALGAVAFAAVRGQ